MSFLSSKVDDAREFLPNLEKIRKENKPVENVRLFKGQKGVETVLQDILHSAKENLIFGSEGYFSKEMPQFAKRFISQLQTRGIKIKSLTRTNRQFDNDLKTKEMRTIPSLTASPVITNIYADKISIIIWSETPEAILIQNQKAADAYRDYYNFMWKYANK